MIRIGIDIGGTFTDFVIYNSDDDHLITFKLLTDKKHPEITILRGLDKFASTSPVRIVHGSTVATNALLEHKGARTALITTKGFGDVLQIGRQNRRELYNLKVSTPPALVPSELRFEINERVGSDGKVIKSIEASELEMILNQLTEKNVESVAVCLLFSFLYPIHEQLIAQKLLALGFPVSTSSEILPEYREYERTSTTVVNAYVSPILERYLSTLETSLPGSNIQVMQSNGGMINISEAGRNGARCILSGPAGGIVGAQNIARAIISQGRNPQDVKDIRLITFDMGGTSTDVSLIKGEPTLTTEAAVGGYPIHLPLLDIHTIGAGGGSIAWVDAGGSLRVGPQSAAADPGPACYGKGELPTVTDANLVLGRIIPEYFLGGEMPIYPDRAFASMARLGLQLNLDPIQTALGIIDVVNIQMERALRVISVERGHDPRDFSLFSFGGAGGLHACELARQVGINRVIIPKYASTLSAFGMLTSNVIRDYVQTIMRSGEIDRKQLDNLYSPIVESGVKDILDQGIPADKVEIQQTMDLRYSGQSYELTIPYTNSYLEDFQEAHSMTYGYAYPDHKVEIVNIRVRSIGKIAPIKLPRIADVTAEIASKLGPSSNVWTKFGLVTTPLYQYERLFPGNGFFGPALIVSRDTTILIGQNDRVAIDQYQNLIIDING